LNTNNIIAEHSKVKLEIYASYLKTYLSIMALPNVSYRDVTIVDPFAGMGKDDNGENGSAIIAYEAIKEKLTNLTKVGKRAHLELNEFDGKRFAKLKENVPADDFVRFSSDTADNFLSDISNKISGASLFFIDPFGYTQISKNTYDRYLFGRSNTDILIFIPVNHIYRFLKYKEKDELLKPIAEFLNDIDISEADAQNVNSYMDFTRLICRALKDRANTQFVYYKKIDHERNTSHYAIFFISRSVLAAQKFLEILDNMKEQNLFYEIVSEPEEHRFIQAIEHYKVLNNRTLYHGGIQCGLLPKDVRKILRLLEKDGKINVVGINGYSRPRRFVFPVDYADYTQTPKVEVHWIGE